MSSIPWNGKLSLGLTSFEWKEVRRHIRDGYPPLRNSKLIFQFSTLPSIALDEIVRCEAAEPAPSKWHGRFADLQICRLTRAHPPRPFKRLCFRCGHIRADAGQLQHVVCSNLTDSQHQSDRHTSAGSGLTVRDILTRFTLEIFKIPKFKPRSLCSCIWRSTCPPEMARYSSLLSDSVKSVALMNRFIDRSTTRLAKFIRLSHLQVYHPLQIAN